jgi:hypothetical protein
MDADREILAKALDVAVPAFAALKVGHSLLTQPTPTEAILDPICAAIEKCEAYQAVSGHVLYSANVGVVIHSPRLALELLYRAERGVPAAAEWLISLLHTRKAKGIFKAAIWGLSLSEEIHLPGSSKLMPFALLPKSRLKDTILERSESLDDNSAWISSRWFDEPDAAFFARFSTFPI